MPGGFLRRIVISCGVAAFALVSMTVNGQANLLTDLGVGTAYGLNNSGQVVLGTSLYSNGTVTPLPIFGYAINDSGEVAGQLSSNGGVYIATYINGTVTNLGVVPTSDPTVDVNEATAVNASGEVVGWGSTAAAESTDSFVYNNGTMTFLTTFPGDTGTSISSQAFGINDGGQVTGGAYNSNTLTIDAFIYLNGTWTDLGPGTGYAINASGEVAGRFPNGSFIYPALPGSTGGIGYAINATGQVVGDAVPHAFFYNGVTTDLNALVSPSDPLHPFVTLTDARGINDAGLIVVNGIDSRTGLTHAYLLQGPPINFAPGALVFPTEPVGAASPTQTVSVTNAGNTTVAIDSVSASTNFIQTNDCAASVASGGGCTITVAFMPATAGNSTGSLTVTSAGTPFVISLSGIAPVSVTIKASASTVMTGVPVTLTWSASPDSVCMANGGTASDGWIGSLPASGTQSVTESQGATYSYGLTCTAGSQSAQAAAPVVVTWPLVTATLTASPTTIDSGQPTTLTWSSKNASSCSATGGGTGDNWPGVKATNGSAAITEPYVPAAQLTLTFTLTCTSAASRQSAQASAKVIQNVPAPTKSGGGGAFDLLSLMVIFSVLALQFLWRSPLCHRGTAVVSGAGGTPVFKTRYFRRFSTEVP